MFHFNSLLVLHHSDMFTRARHRPAFHPSPSLLYLSCEGTLSKSFKPNFNNLNIQLRAGDGSGPEKYQEHNFETKVGPKSPLSRLFFWLGFEAPGTLVQVWRPRLFFCNNGPKKIEICK